MRVGEKPSAMNMRDGRNADPHGRDIRFFGLTASRAREDCQKDGIEATASMRENQVSQRDFTGFFGGAACGSTALSAGVCKAGVCLGRSSAI